MLLILLVTDTVGWSTESPAIIHGCGYWVSTIPDLRLCGVAVLGGTHGVCATRQILRYAFPQAGVMDLVLWVGLDIQYSFPSWSGLLHVGGVVAAPVLVVGLHTQSLFPLTAENAYLSVCIDDVEVEN